MLGFSQRDQYIFLNKNKKMGERRIKEAFTQKKQYTTPKKNFISGTPRRVDIDRSLTGR